MTFNKKFGKVREYGRPRDAREFGGDRGRGGFTKRFGGERGGFSGGAPRDRGQVELFSATCANCNKTCEVPFKPNGTKPVYCKDCFGSLKGDEGRGDRPRRDEGRGRGDRPAFTPRPAENGAMQKDIAQLAAKVDALAKSLDYAILLLKGTAPVKKETPAIDVAPEVAPVAGVVEKASAAKAARIAKKAAVKKPAKGGAKTKKK